MKQRMSRRQFIRAGSASAAMGFVTLPAFIKQGHLPANEKKGKRIGIIGLDTSHSTNIMALLNGTAGFAQADGYRVVAAYPYGSRDIPSSYSRIPAYMQEAEKLGVELVDSIDRLLQKTDFIMLETNDGKPRVQQASAVIRAGKPMFIDKPIASNFKDVVYIYELAEKNKVPLFSSSTLRYTRQMAALTTGQKIGAITGADTYSPAPLQPEHSDFFWYGIHGIESLYTLMGPGCISVTRTQTAGTDLVAGVWKDGRIGSYRAQRTGATDYGGTAFGEKGISTIGSFDGYEGLLEKVIGFFNTGIPPVPATETLEIYAFMEAADCSKKSGGIPVALSKVWSQAELHP